MGPGCFSSGGQRSRSSCGSAPGGRNRRCLSRVPLWKGPETHEPESGRRAGPRKLKGQEDSRSAGVAQTGRAIRTASSTEGVTPCGPSRRRCGRTLPVQRLDVMRSHCPEPIALSCSRPATQQPEQSVLRLPPVSGCVSGVAFCNEDRTCGILFCIPESVSRGLCPAFGLSRVLWNGLVCSTPVLCCAYVSRPAAQPFSHDTAQFSARGDRLCVEAADNGRRPAPGRQLHARRRGTSPSARNLGVCRESGTAPVIATADDRALSRERFLPLPGASRRGCSSTGSCVKRVLGIRTL